MLKPEELLPRETWTFVLSKLSVEDEVNCRCVCVSFQKEVDSILKNNQDRLWLRHRDNDYAHYFCYDKDHKISSRDTLYFDKTICIKNLEFVSNLMPSLKILQLDPLDQVYREDYNQDNDYLYDIYLPDYRDKNGKAVPITKIFPRVTCLILPGDTEEDNFVGDLSQVKHLTVLHGVEKKSTMLPNLDSLEVRTWSNSGSRRYTTSLPMPSKRFVVPDATIEWRTLPKTLQVIETELSFGEYISLGKPHFSNLKILKGANGENLETLMNFLKDHKGFLTELSFSVEEEVANIKVLLPLLTQLQKLSVKIKTVKQAIELKEIKALAYNLQYFELLFALWSSTDENLGAILENLPTGLDNLSIKDVTDYEEIEIFLEKILEKVVNGHTKTVTIADVDDAFGNPEYIMEDIINIKPEPVRVEETNTRVFEHRFDSPGTRTAHFGSICDIVISL